MTTVSATLPRPTVRVREPGRVSRLAAFATLARRRLSLSAHTPRELIVPLMTPILFAAVIAPALAKMTGGLAGGIDYKTFVSVGTVGLLVPLSCTFAGIGVIVDRESGARRELLAAPIPRSLLVFGNLAVALFVSGLQTAALVGVMLLRGAHLHTGVAGVGWFVGANVAFAVFSYAVAETMANKIKTQEEFVGATPAVAIVPWFLAGSLFPLKALPVGLAAVAKILPLTHALALMRYGLVDVHGSGLHDIWGMTSPTAMAWLSMGVVLVWAVVLTAVSVRVFSRAAVQ